MPELAMPSAPVISAASAIDCLAAAERRASGEDRPGRAAGVWHNFALGAGLGVRD